MANSSSGLQSLPSLQKVLVVGGGGREHALGWALSRCPGIHQVWVSPGNGGVPDPGSEGAQGYTRLGIPENDHEGLLAHCRNEAVDLVVVGPEAPLAAGLADHLRAAGLAVFGPGAEDG